MSETLAKCELEYEGCTKVPFWIINQFPTKIMKDVIYYSCDNCYDKFFQCRGHEIFHAERHDYTGFLSALSNMTDEDLEKFNGMVWSD
jgi:hypothetical protein